MGFEIHPVTPFAQNACILWCDETKAAALVDPGGEAPRLLKQVEKLGLKLEKILLTHPHIDHAGATGAIASSQSLPIIGPHKADLFWIEMLPQQSSMFNFEKAEPFLPDQWLVDGDVVQLGNIKLEVIHCPGHTPGHVVFFNRNEKLAWVGDVLFQGSIGRTDFPQGDYDTLISSITNKLWPLGDDVRFIPGHGPMSTFGDERATNPFVGDNVLGR